MLVFLGVAHRGKWIDRYLCAVPGLVSLVLKDHACSLGSCTVEGGRVRNPLHRHRHRHRLFLRYSLGMRDVLWH